MIINSYCIQYTYTYCKKKNNYHLTTFLKNHISFCQLLAYLCIFLCTLMEQPCLFCRHLRADDRYSSTLSRLHRTPVDALGPTDTFLYILHNEDSNFDLADSVCQQDNSLYHRNLQKKKYRIYQFCLHIILNTNVIS